MGFAMSGKQKMISSIIKQNRICVTNKDVEIPTLVKYSFFKKYYVDCDCLVSSWLHPRWIFKENILDSKTSGKLTSLTKVLVITNHGHYWCSYKVREVTELNNQQELISEQIQVEVQRPLCELHSYWSIDHQLSWRFEPQDTLLSSLNHWAAN